MYENFQKFFVYLDNGHDVFKLAIPAKTESDARQFCAGNGEIVAIKNVTEEFPIDIVKVRRALENAQFGEFEMDFICRALENINIAF